MRDGEVVPACAQACPADAIIFGDLNDPESRVSQAGPQRSAAISLLEELGTEPRVTYLKGEGKLWRLKQKPLPRTACRLLSRRRKTLREQLMLDPRPREEMNQMVMESMTHTSLRYWIAVGILAVLVVVLLVRHVGLHDLHRHRHHR